MPTILRDVTSQVKKDVRRTDVLLDLDKRALHNVLTTYALHHPSVGYWQGMSDLLSPLLHVMRTEARAYVAFCGLMRRMRSHFRRDGRSMRTKFRHLERALRLHDPALHSHLRRTGALDLLFCYRWLLLDLKREFPYDDMLTLSEVSWSTLRPLDREGGVELFEIRFPTLAVYQSVKEKVDPRHVAAFTENHDFAASLRRQRNAGLSSSDEEEEEDAAGRRRPRRRRRSHPVCRSWSGADSSAELHHPDDSCYSSTVQESHFSSLWLDSLQASSCRRRHCSGDSNYGSTFSGTDSEDDSATPAFRRSRSDGYTSGLTLSDHSDTDSDGPDCFLDSHLDAEPCLLPPPSRLGDGKPFVLFVCLTMLLEHRDVILSRNIDANEIGMYFDRMVRKHRLSEVLPRARHLFAEYLSSGWMEDH